MCVCVCLGPQASAIEVARRPPVPCAVFCRTATVWRSLNPFWGEEYTIHLPLDFHHLAFYVLDEDTVGHDDIIGKISLSREAIAADPRGIDSWIDLSRVDPDAEVQGEVCLDVQILEGARGRCLRCHVLQARDLAPRDVTGTSDPFARVFWGSQSLETSKTRFPHWDEVLELPELPGAPAPLRVELWDWDMVGKNDFLGMAPQGLAVCIDFTCPSLLIPVRTGVSLASIRICVHPCVSRPPAPVRTDLMRPLL
ncbi:rasGAP-activating-like protein 1 [Crocuta crocuta]